MPAKSKATVETFRELIALRKKAKRGEWLALLRLRRISQPTAWRYMRFAAQAKTHPRWAWLREQDRLFRRIQADERKHGRLDLSKLARAVAKSDR